MDMYIMKQNNLRVSVIIPAWNEEDRIAACLQALMAQTIKPYEIIVVNNNSTDQTEVIAHQFKGIKIIKEDRQGRAFAQKTGFNAATGDILARIDADTIIPQDWVKDVIKIFRSNKEPDAISGYGQTYTGVKWPAASRIWAWSYYNHCRGYFGYDVLWGSNMAMTKKIWHKARSLLVMREDIHEDEDLSLALASVGANMQVLPSLVVGVDFGGVQYFGKYLEYNKMKRRVKYLHKEHYERNLLPQKQYPLPKRVYYYLMAAPFANSFYLITLTFSAAKVTRELSKSFVYYWRTEKNEID